MESVVISGAGRGLGFALLNEMIQRGAYVYPIVRKKEDVSRLKNVFLKNCHPILADIKDESCIEIISNSIKEHTNSVDIVINNAGVPGKEYRISDVTQQEMMDVFQTHCMGAINVSKATLPFLEKSSNARIINVSSRLGSLTKMSSGEFKNRKFSYSYRIAKAAQNMFTVCLNNELQDKNIGVMAIHPGQVVTDSAANDAKETAEHAAKRIYDWIEQLTDNDHGTYQYPGFEEFPW